MNYSNFYSSRQSMPKSLIESNTQRVAFPALKPGLKRGSAKPLSCYPPDVHAYALNAERCVCSETERPKRSA